MILIRVMKSILMALVNLPTLKFSHLIKEGSGAFFTFNQFPSRL